jgi:hypothetical protein
MGNPSHRPLPENEPEVTGRPIKPRGVKGLSAKVWNEYLDRLPWLGGADSDSFGAWCRLTAEIRLGLDKMDSARITQWRLLGSDLGVTPASRTKLGTSRGAAVTPRKNDEPHGDPETKYFSRPS